MNICLLIKNSIWFHIKFVNVLIIWVRCWNGSVIFFYEEKISFLLAGFILSTDDASSHGHVSAKHPLTLMSRTWKYVNVVKLITPFIIICLIYLAHILSAYYEDRFIFLTHKYYFRIITLENKWTHYVWFRERITHIFSIYF